MTAVTAERRSLAGLIDLAKHHSREDRSALYERIADLYQTVAGDLPANERALLAEIMRALTAQVESAIRLRLAERLADRADAPHDLILLLANDAVEVATPVLMHSLVLTDDDLINLIASLPAGHQLAIAKRAHLNEPVSHALIATEIETVLVTVAGNNGARITERDFAALVDRSRSLNGLQSALVSRADLPRPLAIKMCHWVSAALKAHIASTFDIDPGDLERDLKTAVSAELASDTIEPRLVMFYKLVDKLSANGQLKPGFLVKALRDGQVDLFRIALGRLLGFNYQTVCRITDDESTVPIALAVRASGIDRSAFQTVLEGVRGKGVMANIAPEARAPLLAALQTRTTEEALDTLKAWVSGAA